MSAWDFDHDEELRDEQYERSKREHPALFNGPPRVTVHCPVCGRGMASAFYLELPHWRETGLAVCSSCREHERRISHVEELRRTV